MIKKRVVEIFYFDAGGGHRSAMTALSDALQTAYPDWQIKPTNLQELLESIDPIYKVTDKLSAIREVLDEVKPKLTPLLQRLLETIAPKLTFRVLQSDQFYNELLKRGVRSGIEIVLPILQNFIRLSSGRIAALLTQHWNHTGNRPDMVISVIPNFNAVLYRTLKKTHPQVPYITIMTDMVDIPPHFWMEKQDQIMICGTQKAYKQALASKFYRRENIYQVSGMILKKYFYEQPSREAVTLKSLGLSSSPKMTTALVMFGGNGSAVSQQIVKQLNISDLNIQTIVMCGHNLELLESLRDEKRCCPVPFQADITPYLKLADFMIGKPGPGSISEALHMGCPVLIESTATTLPQERPNVEWVLQNAVGATVKNFSTEIVDAARRMISHLDFYRIKAAKLPPNRAIFEITDILGDVMDHPNISVNENHPDFKIRKWRLHARARSMRLKKLLRKAR